MVWDRITETSALLPSVNDQCGMESHFLQGKGMNRKVILKVNLKEVYRIEKRDGDVLEGQVREEQSAQGTGVVMKAKRPSVDFLAEMKAHGNGRCREREDGSFLGIWQL